MTRPRMRVKMEHTTVSQACNLSQLRFVGRARAGREMRKVKKTKIAFTIPAVDTQSVLNHDMANLVDVPVSGHSDRSNMYGTLDTVGVACSCC